MIRAGMSEAVPFAKYVGVELLEVGDGFARAELVQRPDLSNHISTVHAAALFTLAETASGAAMAGAFAELLGSLRPVAAEARIAYLRLASGKVSCTATTAEPAAELRRRLHEAQTVVFDVAVSVARDDGQQVASMTVTWNVRFASPRPAG